MSTVRIPGTNIELDGMATTVTYQDGSSDKFWRLYELNDRDGHYITIKQWGKRGHTGQFQVRETSLSENQSELESKRRKGYGNEKTENVGHTGLAYCFVERPGLVTEVRQLLRVLNGSITDVDTPEEVDVFVDVFEETKNLASETLKLAKARSTSAEADAKAVVQLNTLKDKVTWLEAQLTEAKGLVDEAENAVLARLDA